MRSDHTFATMPTATTMDTRDKLLAELGGTSLDNLRKILDAIRLRRVTAEDNNEENSSNHKANQATASLSDNDTHQEQPVAPKEPDHTGTFAIAYANITQARTHTELHTDFNAVDPDIVHQYMRELNEINVAQ